MKKLSQSQVEARIEHLDGWETDESGGLMQKEYRFEDFKEAMVFVNAIAKQAEEMQHHPDVCISYNSVVCMVTTHEKEGLTEADFKLVKAIEKESEVEKGTDE